MTAAAEKGKNYMFWLSFFRGAGILSSFDTKYALAFDENRIKPDMLLDLNKECLRDMEITAMGDIIAILRHAKKAHEESKTSAFEKTKPDSLASVMPPPPPPTAILPLATITSTKSTEKVTTTTPALASSQSQAPKVKPSATVQTAKSTPLVSKSNASPESSYSSTTTSSSTLKLGTKSKPSNELPPGQTEPQKRIIIINRGSSSDSDSSGTLHEEVPFQKKTRVLPEHEGNYKIKMPEGTISRTQHLLNNRLGPSPNEANLKSVDKKGIFSRLGGSGSEEVVRPSSSSLKTPSTDKHDKDSSSVFQRLGERGSRTSEPNLSRRNIDTERHDKRDVLRDEDEHIRLRRSSPTTHRTWEKSSSSDSDKLKRINLYNNSSRGRISEAPPAKRRSVERNDYPSRMRSEVYSGGGRSDRIDVRSRLGGSNSRLDEPKRTSKIISTSSIKNGGDLRVGQVLKTTRIQRSDGKSVVQRVIVKRVSKSKSSTHSSRQYDRSPQSLPEIDDPLAELFDD